MPKYFSLSHITSGFIGVLVGFTSSAVIVFQAATEAGASPAEISSWLFALGLALASTCAGLSLYYKTPILIGWSTPGAALLVTNLTGMTMSEAIGAFIFAAILTIIFGITGLFERLMVHIPRAITSAMLAGILLHFGTNVFSALQQEFSLVFIMLLMHLLGKRFFPRYSIIFVLAIGIITASLQGLFHIDHIHLSWPAPVFTFPTFSFSSLVSVGIPLFIVNMASQNIPGISVLNNSGYNPHISPLITWTGVATLVLAPFGCFSIGLAALSAAICTNAEADSNPVTRYRSTVCAGFFWLLVGLLGATIVTLFFAFPSELIIAVAGIALFGTVGSSLKSALTDEKHLEPAIITLLISTSGITFFGIGSACWGLITGLLASSILNGLRRGGKKVVGVITA